MKKIKEMIESAPTKSMALTMLTTHQVFGKMTNEQFKKGRVLINKQFAK